MKTAVCLSGFMRCYKASLPSLNYLLFKPLEVDLFISTWDIAGHSHRHWSNGREPEEQIAAKDLKQAYGDRLKGCNIVPFDLESVTPGWIKEGDRNIDAKSMMRRVTSMYFHIYQANQLKKAYEKAHDFKYDVVIRLRSEILFAHSLIHWINQRTELRSNLVHTSTFERYGILNDQFMYGSSEAMDVVAGIYPAIQENSPTVHQPSHGYCLFTPAEGLLKHYLNYNKIEYQEHHISYKR